MITQCTVRNRLLRTLTPSEFLLVQRHLKAERTRNYDVLIAPGVPIQRVFFIESGYASITKGDGHRRVEIGLIGREGLVGATPLLLGANTSPYSHFIQAEGDMLSMRSDDLISATRQSPSLCKLLLLFIHTLSVQTSETAFAGASHHVDARLARWILMCGDRVDGEVIPLTHDFLSMMLGLQRTSVTLALQNLEGKSLIWARRGEVTVRNRQGLIEAANTGYGLAEAEYERLIPPSTTFENPPAGPPLAA